jgi:2,3-bisphosphoglycerate-independent phosphoglycerate mutase
MDAKKVILLIMDGWGIGAKPSADAVFQADTPFTDSLYKKYPHTTLVTCGGAVGLPDGQMGNSEVGHLNLGAGRVVYQELQRIHVAVRDGSFAQNPVLVNTLNYAKSNDKALHLIGLVSDGGVHSHTSHLRAITSLCKEMGVTKVYIHAFLDGRDTDPKSGKGYLTALQQHLVATTGTLATVIGRYYAMDRDKRWERVQLAYEALVKGVGEPAADFIAAVETNYANGVTDEFMKPLVTTAETAASRIQPGDAVICFNFRTDRCREITQVLTQTDMPDFGMHKLDLHYTTMTEYDQSFKGINVIFETDNLNNTLGQVMAANGLTQLRAAETEKYPHVTFFFSGGREAPFEGEQRIMALSPKVATYDLQPEMSAVELTNALLPEIEKQAAHFMCINFANADMVGHTGVWNAVIKAVETVDACVERIVTTALANGYTVFLTADHGNADYMINDDGSPNTAHSLNPVPFWIIDKAFAGAIKPGKLGDLAPTILTMMHLKIPAEMTGEILI